MAQYLTFAEYTEMGGTITDEKQYSRLEYRARASIDRRTFRRVQGDNPQREAVKRLVFDLVGLYSANEAKEQAAAVDGGAVESYSNDGVSVKFKLAAALTAEQLDTQADEIIDDYLMNERSRYGTPLLYTGVPICP